ncbi:MAG: cytochrome c oxidase subunit II [Pseudonocardiales bacterium]|nr:MAG: cytochrome c oxidase subunit II [Pseudonocardiales bacterium]
MPFRDVFDQVLGIWSVIAAVVFGLVIAILLVAIVRNRIKRRPTLPFVASKNTPLELGYVVVLGVIAAGLIVGSFLANSRLHDGVGLAATATPPAARINVTAFRWCWDFAYQAAPVHVTGECAPGDVPTVVVAAGQPVEFDITSRDVVHAFWLPDFAVKRYAYPDHVNTLRMVFPRQGRWRGRCAEYCGTHHVTMDFYVKVVSPAQYQQFLHSGGTAL